MNKIKVGIIICIVMIIIIIGLVVILNKSKTNPEIIMQDEESMGVNEFTDEIIEQIDYSEWFQVEQSINEYLSVVNKDSDSYYDYDENDNYVKTVEESDIKEKIYNLLSNNYIKKNNITIDNVYDYVDNITTKQIYTILKIRKKVNNNSNQYITTGFIEENDMLKKEEKFIVNLNLKDGVFSIEPVNYDTKIDDLDIKDVSVKKNEDNTTPIVSASAENIVGKYFTITKRMMLIYPEKLYEYLDEDYRNKRFGSLEDYKDYIDKNKEEFKSFRFVRYMVNNYNDYTQFVCEDQYENTYIFNEKGVMNFTLQLDTYTIPTEKFINTYKSSNEQKNIMMNIEKWIKMLNRRDYKSAYQVLDETFRNNNFGTEEEFEKYMREKLPLHYDIEYTDISEENGVYVQNITLSDITKNDESKIQASIIMKLKNNYDFTMSFNI